MAADAVPAAVEVEDLAERYGAFLLEPLLGSAVATHVADSGILATILDLLPLGQAARLLGDGPSSQGPFDAGPAAWPVIGGWGLVGHGAPAWIVARRGS